MAVESKGKASARMISRAALGPALNEQVTAANGLGYGLQVHP
jgi:hypothetical protein